MIHHDTGNELKKKIWYMICHSIASKTMVNWFSLLFVVRIQKLKMEFSCFEFLFFSFSLFAPFIYYSGYYFNFKNIQSIKWNANWSEQRKKILTVLWMYAILTWLMYWHRDTYNYSLTMHIWIHLRKPHVRQILRVIYVQAWQRKRKNNALNEP